jgi:septal ring factor EnvC (AmiA/AmiB activator)
LEEGSVRGAFLFVSETAQSKLLKQERKDMEQDMGKGEKHIVERLEAATNALEKTLNWLEERQGALSGEVERITATVEQSRRETELTEKLAAVERELAEVKAATAQNVLSPLRRTMPAATAEMLAKHGIGDGPVDVRALDAALSGLSLEQRIAVKTQLLRAGAIA